MCRHFLGSVSLVYGDQPERAAFRRGLIHNLMVLMSGTEMAQAHVWVPCAWTERGSYLAVIQQPAVVPKPVETIAEHRRRDVPKPGSPSLFG